jgi:hypothetical protein
MVGAYISHPEENAMSTVCQFLVKFASLIVCVLHCFDRVIFKGHLAMARPAELERFVDYVLRVRRCHFIKILAPQWYESLVEHAKRWARKHKRTYLYRKGSFKKDQWAERLIRDQRIERGLVGILCTQETCNFFALVPGEKLPRFISKPRQQNVLYYKKPKRPRDPNQLAKLIVDAATGTTRLPSGC